MTVPKAVLDDDLFDDVPRAEVSSPCIGVCQVDPATRTCKGCRRTLAEIAEWPNAGDERRQAIRDRLEGL